jgi:phosphatidylinositol alpha 1,6-mannosyltransferase
MLRFRPDVVHVASPATLGAQALKAAAELGIPTVAIYQTDLVGFAGRYQIAGGALAMSALTRKIHAGADRTLAPSASSVRQLAEMGVDRVHLWPRGVDAVQFHPRHRSESLRAQLAPSGERLVGYVGRLAPEKELDLLTHLNGREAVRIVVVGGGPEEQRLRALLPGAAFLGVRHGDDLAAAYASLDVFVHTGRYETFGQAVQEALASGVPVVAPRAGGPLDVVDEGVNGLFFTPGDGADLVRAAARFLDDEALRTRFARAARLAVEDRTWARVMESLVGHYREVATQSQPYRADGPPDLVA